MSRTVQCRESSANLGSSESQPYHGDSEQALLSASREGDNDAFAELCRRHGQILRRKIITIVRHREDAEDVCQDTLLKAYRNLGLFKGTCKFQTWLVRIGINSSLMLLRKRKARSKLTTEPYLEDDAWCDGSLVRDSAPNPEQQYVGEHTRRLIAQSISRLRWDFQHLLERHYGDGRSVSDLALDLGISAAAVKARMHRARRLLRARLEGRLLPS